MALSKHITAKLPCQSEQVVFVFVFLGLSGWMTGKVKDKGWSPSVGLAERSINAGVCTGIL